MAPSPTVDIRRAQDRFATTTSWLDSKHSFSFGDHYDPDNTHHGLLLVNNDDIVEPAAGFETHPHRDMEIVTWVLRGALAHRDSVGNTGVVYPGLAQRMSAGSGIQHSEMNDSTAEPVHFVQMWIVPDEVGLAPSYQQREIGDDLLGGVLVPIASGRPGDNAAIAIHNRNATLHGARLQPGNEVAIPRAPFVHLFVAAGQIRLEDIGDLYEGDAVRLTNCDARRVTASALSQILIWEMHAGLGG